MSDLPQMDKGAAMAISAERLLMNTIQRTVDALVGIMTSLDAPAETMEALTAGDLEHVCWWVTTHRAAAANSERVERYHAARRELQEYKEREFGKGMRVRVDSGRYRGPGSVVADSQCPPDQVAVQLENGNVWWYPIDHVRKEGEGDGK